ncbi:(-)-germacrene D synthase-like protein [Drosera capensis]
MKAASVNCGYPMLSVASLVGMGDRVTQRDFDWMLSEPKCLKAVSVICRLMDDMVSHKFEQQGEHIPSAVECYTRQHGVSEEQACQVFKGLVEDAWKDLNEAFLMPTPASKSVLTRLLNLTRVMEVLYKHEDTYTHSNTRFKDYITNLLIYPVEIR